MSPRNEGRCIAMTPAQLAALKAYADGRRPDLTATELAAARKALSAAGLVRDSGHGPMYVELVPKPAPVHSAQLDLFGAVS